MGKRLFVGNLSFNSTEDGLQAIFEQGGFRTASISIVADRDTGRSRGFAFVEMESDTDAQAAIKALDGANFDGRPLRVNEAEEKKPRWPWWRRRLVATAAIAVAVVVAAAVVAASVGESQRGRGGVRLAARRPILLRRRRAGGRLCQPCG
jgi:RNA recognition motif-containing protein